MSQEDKTELCGAWAGNGYCTMLKGHNMGHLDIPDNHKSCHPHPDAPHGFDCNASHNAGRYVCECEGWQPVAAQEPAQQLANKLGMMPTDAWRFTGIEASLVIAALYANAAPCARCTELEAEIMCIHDVRDNKPWRELREAQAKITEQAAELSRETTARKWAVESLEQYKAECTQLYHDVDRLSGENQQQSDRIKALEAKRDKLILAVADHVTVRSEQFATIERQRKVIELCKEGWRQWHFPENRYAALAAIAELEKGVG